MLISLPDIVKYLTKLLIFIRMKKVREIISGILGGIVMYCPTCGRELETGMSVCPVCGMNIQMYEQTYNHNNVDEMNIVSAVNLAREGKEEGFNYLYENTYRNNFYMALKYMKNQEDALDVLQTAYMRAFSRLDLLRDAEKFSGWMSVIVANTAKNMLQRKNPVLFSDIAQDNAEGEPMEFQLVDESEQYQPEVAYSKQETQMLVHEMIDALSDEQRLCILMFYIEGQSVNEIAEALECPKNTVLSRLNYGRKNIKAKAEELQRKGYKIYSVAPIPFLIYLLRTEAKLVAASGAAEIAGGAGVGASIALRSGANGMNAGYSAVGDGADIGSQAAKEAAKEMSKEAAKKAAKKAFLQTVAGKVTVAAAGVVVLGGVVGGGIYFVHSQKNKDVDNDTTEDIQAEITTDAQTDTEEIVEVTTEEATEELIIDESYKEAYLEILESNKDAIVNYDWQYDYIFENNDISVDPRESAPIAVCDVTGDNVPELIFVSAENESASNLVIYTCEDGKAKQIYNASWDIAVAGGTDYYLFQVDGSTDLYAFSTISDEGWWDTYIQFGIDESGRMYEKHKWTLSASPNDDYSDMNYDYAQDDSEITGDEYDKVISDLKDNMNVIVMFDGGVEAELQEFAGDLEILQMTYEEAILFLGGTVERESTSKGGTAALPESLPEDLPESFSFASGVGAWSTSIHIDSDGTFEGFYYDMDMGVSGEEYPGGTMYVCSFSGKFTNIKKVNEYTYSMELEYIDREAEPGEEWIENEIKYIASEPYGLEEGKEFLLYLPEAPMSELPESFVEWISMPLAWGNDGRPETLPFYGLYNVTGEYGFFSSAN